MSDGFRTVRLTATRAREARPAASPDGRSIAFERMRAQGSELWTMSVDGTNETRLTTGRWDLEPAWSPDGASIYFVRFFEAAYGAQCGSIFRIGTDGQGLGRVTRAHVHSHSAPAVSPDGSRIAFTDANQCEGGTTSYALRVVDTSGAPTSDLAALPGNAHYPVSPEYEDPTWSPDGSRIAMLANLALIVASRDRSDVRPVTPPRLRVGEPAWSPDGDWIAFTSDSDVYVIRPDGTDLRRLTQTGAAYEDSPSWLPALPVGLAPSLNGVQKRIARQLVSVYENSQTTPAYGYVENLHDGCGYTAGWVGFCTATGDLLDVVRRYVHVRPGNALQRYLPRLRALAAAGNDGVEGLPGFARAWPRSALHPRFRQAQNAVAESLYYRPALRLAADEGLRSPLAVAIFFETAVQHGTGDEADGLPALIARADAKAGGTVALGIEELAWLTAFNAVRADDLLQPANTDRAADWPGSVDRAYSDQRLVDGLRIDLRPPVAVAVFGDSFVLR